MTLTGFLAARLDEDEATARHSGPALVAWLTLHDSSGQMGYTTVASSDEYGPWVADGRDLPEPASARIVYDPARVLREVEAKRAIIRDAESLLDPPLALAPFLSAADPLYGDVLNGILRHLAAAWSDHPDYDPAWTPAKER